MLKPRHCIATLDPYRSPVGRSIGLNLDLNENAAGCSERVLARLRTLTARDISMYPNREEGETLVANFLGVRPDQLLLTNGIDEGLYLLSATYLAEGDEMLFADPTFVMYPIYGHSTGARVVRVRADDDFAFPTRQILAAISPHTRLITIANPNNPTGTVVPREDLVCILNSALDAAVLVDEAYFECGGETLLPDLAKHPNLFIARTFSKAYGLAGLRLGVLIAAPEQIAYLRSFCSPFNVNAVALACLEEALADQSFVADYVAQIKQGREQLTELCAELDLRSWPSRANFVLVRIGVQCGQFAETMARLGVQIRDQSTNPGGEGCVRITIGMQLQMNAVLRCMREATAEIRS
jgi:histidinol-phosphate aminotransferase